MLRQESERIHNKFFLGQPNRATFRNRKLCANDTHVYIGQLVRIANALDSARTRDFGHSGANNSGVRMQGAQLRLRLGRVRDIVGRAACLLEAPDKLSFQRPSRPGEIRNGGAFNTLLRKVVSDRVQNCFPATRRHSDVSSGLRDTTRGSSGLLIQAFAGGDPMDSGLCYTKEIRVRTSARVQPVSSKRGTPQDGRRRDQQCQTTCVLPAANILSEPSLCAI